MMLGAVDTVMLSQYSDESVAAVGVVNQIVMFAFLIFEVINIGTSVLCSQYLGAGMRNKMVQVVGVSLLLNLVVGLVVSAILHYGATTLLGWMGLRPELLKYGIGYMEIVGAFAFFQAISLTISASLRSANKAIYPMLVTVLVNVMNIIGNYSLIFGKFGLPAMGAEGAAISTSIARGVSMIVSPGDSSVPASILPIITLLAPAASAFAISPEYLIPPSAIIGLLYSRATLAAS